ncbi:trichohyalin-like protein [Lates japonicus]|uniref:Trichohyalin-like protein n=1 Tax=Lates japonicus TaxID=270547 RepID=A0AAD3NIE0_LATJO|nr:trichohyalin-like protein [Lates japonicus]
MGDPATVTVPVSSSGKQAGSSTSKPGVSCGRSNSLGSRGSDSTASGSKVGGSLKRGSLSHQGTRQASHPGRTALRLCSSRSFSSLHTSSLTAAPFMRSSRSLNRLDQRSTGQGVTDGIAGWKELNKSSTYSVPLLAEPL